MSRTVPFSSCWCTSDTTSSMEATVAWMSSILHVEDSSSSNLTTDTREASKRYSCRMPSLRVSSAPCRAGAARTSVETVMTLRSATVARRSSNPPSKRTEPWCTMTTRASSRSRSAMLWLGIRTVLRSWRVRRRVHPERPDRTSVGHHEAGQQFDGRALPGAVGARVGHHLAPSHFKAHALQRLDGLHRGAEQTPEGLAQGLGTLPLVVGLPNISQLNDGVRSRSTVRFRSVHTFSNPFATPRM